MPSEVRILPGPLHRFDRDGLVTRLPSVCVRPCRPAADLVNKVRTLCAECSRDRWGGAWSEHQLEDGHVEPAVELAADLAFDTEELETARAVQRP